MAVQQGDVEEVHHGAGGVVGEGDHGVVDVGLEEHAKLLVGRRLQRARAVQGRIGAEAVIRVVLGRADAHDRFGLGGGDGLAALVHAPHVEHPFVILAEYRTQVHGIFGQQRVAVGVQGEGVGRGQYGRGHHHRGIGFVSLEGAQRAVLNGAAAHGVAHHAHPGKVHVGQRFQILQGGEGAEILHEAVVDAAVGVGGMAVGVGVEGQDHDAPARQFDGVDVLHLGRIVVAVHGHHGGHGSFRRGRARNVQQGPHEAAVLRHEADIADLHLTVAGVHLVGHEGGREDHNQGQRHDDNRRVAAPGLDRRLIFHELSPCSR